MRYGYSIKRPAQAFATLVCAVLAFVALAQEKYPSRPVEFIVPWGPGGGADQLARKAGKLMEEDLKVSFPVVNSPGATGNTGMAKLLAAQPDGYSISILTWDTYALLATTNTRWGLKDIIPVALMIKQPSSFLTATNGPLKTWADVEREARTRPLKVAVTGFGSPDEITVNFFVARGLKLDSGPLRQPERTLYGSPRRTCRCAVRADRRRPQLRRQQADTPGDRLRRQALQRLPRRAGVEGARLRHHAAAAARRDHEGGHRSAESQDDCECARKGCREPRIPRRISRISTRPTTAISAPQESLKIMEDELAQMKKMAASAAPK